MKTVKVTYNYSFQGFAFVIMSLLFLWMVLNSCSPERKMANTFIKNESIRSALLISPQFIFKENLKKEILDSLEIKDESLFDSVLMANSQLLQFVDDSLFIANYMLGLYNELKQFGFLVYREEFTNEFMDIDSNAFIINVAQIEIEEAHYTQRDDVTIYDTYYYHDHELNAAYISSWIEISDINSNKSNHDVYFTSDIITDDLEGEFVYGAFSEDLKYLFEIDTLKHADLYDFAYLLGRTYAGYTFDLLLNKYLKDNLPDEQLSDNYWRYDPALGNLFYATEDKFILLEE